MTPANDNKTDEAAGGKLSRNTLFAALSAAVVVLTVLSAIAVTEPPWVVRDLKRDQGLTGRLNAIQLSIASYHRAENKLPASLTDLLTSPQTTAYNVTAEGLKDFDYTPSGDGRSYELCTVFLRASGGDSGYFTQNWKHEAGRSCFKLKTYEKLGVLPGGDGTFFTRY